MPSETDITLFCIRATLRINEQFRHAYADSTRSRAITLPLPNFPAAVERISMESFYRFGDGKEFFDSNLRVWQVAITREKLVDPKRIQQLVACNQQEKNLACVQTFRQVSTG
jgi:hypothetical protein